MSTGKKWIDYSVLSIITIVALLFITDWIFNDADRIGLIITVISSVTLNILLLLRIRYLFKHGLPKEEEPGPGAGVQNHSRDLY